jgi:hypothetical protein
MQDYQDDVVKAPQGRKWRIIRRFSDFVYHAFGFSGFSVCGFGVWGFLDLRFGVWGFIAHLFEQLWTGWASTLICRGSV